MRRSRFLIFSMILPLITPGSAFAAETTGSTSSIPSVNITSSSTCKLPISQRQGAWFCFADNTINLPTFKKSILDPPTYRDRYCLGGPENGAVCWTVLDDFTGYFDGSGIFGWDTTVVGSVEVIAEYKITGSNITSKPVTFLASVGTTEVTFEGDLLNACGGQAGNAVDGKYSFYTIGSLGANQGAFWDPNGYNSYWDGGVCKSQVHEWVWRVDDYPGRWYLVGKSMVAALEGNDPLYRFASAQPVDLPDTPFTGQYSSS
jgi:hypothetical protein